MKRTVRLLILALLLFILCGGPTSSPDEAPLQDPTFCEEWLQFSDGTVVVYTADWLQMEEP